MQLSSYKKSFRNFLLATTSFLAFSCGGTSVNPTTQDNAKNNDTTSVVAVTNPIVSISFRNDTLYTPSSTLLYYMNNSITRNYVEKRQSYRLQLPYFAHEHQHDNNEKIDNNVKSYRYKYLYSPSEYGILCMFDEISANLAAIETAAFEYLASSDKDAVIKKYEKTYMKFYFTAIKEGQIKPLEFGDFNDIKQKQQELDAYRSFVINGTQDMWQKTYRRHYSPTHFNMVMRYINLYGLQKSHKANFNHVLKHMLTIGGVDFSQYLDHIIQPFDERVKILDDMAYVTSFTQDRKSTNFIVSETVNHFKELDFNDSELKSGAQHFFIATLVKNELKDYTPQKIIENPAIVNKAYYKVMYTLSHDASFQGFIDNFSIAKRFNILDVSPDREGARAAALSFRPQYSQNYQNKVKNFYSYKGIQLTDLLPSFDINLLPNSINGFFASNSLAFVHYQSELQSLAVDVFHIKSDNGSIITEPISNISVENTTTKPMATQDIAKRKISGEMYMPLIDFKQPVLIPEMLTNSAKNKIVEMFKMFDDIPQAFKNCDTLSQQNYIREHGHPHYFENRDMPLQSQARQNKVHKQTNTKKSPLLLRPEKNSRE